MKKLIRHKVSGHFLTDKGKWCADISEAAEFHTRAAALAIADFPPQTCEFYFWLERLRLRDTISHSRFGIPHHPHYFLVTPAQDNR